MGAVLDTPTRCPLCNELTAEPVTLKCNHRFCQRCIGDLWSVAPNGPYHCPEWRCKTVYHTLPFDSSLIRRPPTNNRGAQPRSTADTPSNEQNTSDSTLRRPSLTSRLLGKRKASTPIPEQPNTKRSTVESPRHRPSDTETPTTSISDKPGQSTSVGTSKKAVQPESTQSARGDGASSSKTSDSKEVPASDVPHVSSVQQDQRKSEEVVSLVESDSSDEVDICDAPPLATPKKDTQVTGIHASPQKPASSANSFPWVSTPGKDKSPVHNVSKSSPISTKTPATASESQSRFDTFPRLESKNAKPVPCHYCPKTRANSAVKTCLVCGASMCTEHLRPHLESPVFQNHTLVSPVEDISTWRCQEHQEVNRIYCRECGVCVCTVCTVIGSHRDHVCISIREAERELRGNLKEEIKQLQEAEQQVKNRLTEFTQKKEAFRVLLSEARAGVQQQYAAIREALEQEEQSALQCVTKEEIRVLGGLEEKVGRLRGSMNSLQQGLLTLEGLADTKADKRIQEQAFIMEYSKIAHLSSNMGNCVGQFEAPEELDQARLKYLQRWTEKRLDTVAASEPGKDIDVYRLLYGSIPVLDADTAHPKLQLSDNNRRVTYSEAQQAYTEHEARFSSFPQVMASCALEGGRWYWEVDVSVDEGRWKVGVCEGQIERKGQKDNSRLGFNSYSWCLACDRRKVEALHNKVTVPVDAEDLQRVGVFLDFEGGILSFFNVTPGGSIALMHSYRHKFTDPLYPALSVSKTHLAICDLFQS
ncbi:E3 ubiquitin/ISG15 ligase TRIM25 [Larimichthys crocea]|uniref:E3 ubiquitin/ISG15 ligase TRIM25 n=1 Tax=Larimichthys crocea TaxID=215358 RepID=UPI000900ECF1|nr:E3 ubiquitin/ISG15 ligase TRIM25-like [Larimichthys crocea]